MAGAKAPDVIVSLTRPDNNGINRQNRLDKTELIGRIRLLPRPVSTKGETMKTTQSIVAVLCLGMILAGCLSTGPAVSKSNLGNLQINVIFPKGLSETSADIYLDDIFIGNASPNMPVIYAKRGDRTVRIEADGCQTYQRTITILGDPNHQVLNVRLKKDQGITR